MVLGAAVIRYIPPVGTVTYPAGDSYGQVKVLYRLGRDWEKVLYLKNCKQIKTIPFETLNPMAWT